METGEITPPENRVETDSVVSISFSRQGSHLTSIEVFWIFFGIKKTRHVPLFQLTKAELFNVDMFTSDMWYEAWESNPCWKESLQTTELTDGLKELHFSWPLCQKTLHPYFLEILFIQYFTSKMK